MKNQIPQFLQDKLQLSYALTNKFPNNIKEFMTDYAVFYKWNITDDYQIIFRLLKNNISEMGICEYSKCNNLKYITVNGNIAQGCCKKHTTIISNLKHKGIEWDAQSTDTQEKKKKTNLERYGVDNPMQMDDIVLKGKITKLERYGSKNYNNISQMQETMLIRYGDYNPMRIKKFKDKSVASCMLKFGVPYHTMSEKSKDITKATNLRKYGVDNPMKNADIQNKNRETMLLNHGVEYPAQNPIIFEKIMKSSYKFIDYIWKTGEVSLVQGFEPIVLKELEDSGYGFHDVLTSTTDMPEIFYIFEEKTHRYYPDFYIPAENKVIEVKSDWTLKLHWERNQAKFKAVEELGFEFILEVR